MSPRATATRHFSLLDALGATAGQQNEMLLIQLRWLAVLGQVATIVLSTLLFGLSLPLAAMFAVVGALVLLNLLTMLRPRRDGEVRNIDLMGGLLLDIAALTALLYFSGGASNPFVFLYLLQREAQAGDADLGAGRHRLPVLLAADAVLRAAGCACQP